MTVSATGLHSGTRWPITRVLGAFYTLSTFAMLLLACGFLYWEMKRSLEEQNFHALADEVGIVRAVLKEEDIEAVRTEIQDEWAARLFGKFYARVLDQDGHVLVQTEGMDQIAPPDVFPTAPPLSASPERAEPRTQGTERWLLMTAWAENGKGGGQCLLHVALDVTQDHIVLGHYRRMLGFVLLAGIFCSAGAGALIARRGMRPLAEITEAAGRITANQLNERIVPSRWPKELTAMAIAFDEMLTRLEVSFRGLSQFSADLAHEFRTPVTNLRVESEVALTRDRTPEEYRRILESSLEEYERLSRMIDSLLFLARSENAETALDHSTLKAEEEIKAVIAFYEAAASEKGVRLELRGDGFVQADSTLFRRAISNLVGNALNHTPSGGRIVVATSASSTNGSEVTVEDNGCGIAEKHLPNVFDRFYRVDPSRNSPGVGLGLAIVKSIMRLHGGSARIQSQPGKGTRVILSFPQRPSAAR